MQNPRLPPVTQRRQASTDLKPQFSWTRPAPVFVRAHHAPLPRALAGSGPPQSVATISAPTRNETRMTTSGRAGLALIFNPVARGERFDISRVPRAPAVLGPAMRAARFGDLVRHARKGRAVHLNTRGNVTPSIGTFDDQHTHTATIRLARVVPTRPVATFLTL